MTDKKKTSTFKISAAQETINDTINELLAIEEMLDLCLPASYKVAEYAGAGGNGEGVNEERASIAYGISEVIRICSQKAEHAYTALVNIRLHDDTLDSETAETAERNDG